MGLQADEKFEPFWMLVSDISNTNGNWCHNTYWCFAPVDSHRGGQSVMVAESLLFGWKKLVVTEFHVPSSPARAGDSLL